MSDTLRAKFRIHTLKDHGNSVQIEGSPVYPGDDEDHENKRFWEASPSGSFELYVDNDAALDAVRSLIGKEVYIDITVAD